MEVFLWSYGQIDGNSMDSSMDEFISNNGLDLAIKMYGLWYFYRDVEIYFDYFKNLSDSAFVLKRYIWKSNQVNKFSKTF